MSCSRKIVVLGGNGFIGRHLVDELRHHSATVTVVSRRVRDEGNRGGTRYLRGDVTDGARMHEVLRDASVVYQLTLEADSALGARTVAEACLANGVTRLIFASTSDALYLGGRRAVDESAGTDPKPQLRNPYARAKIASERLLLTLHEQRRLPVVIMRPCLVVGAGGSLAHGGLGTWRAPTCLVGWGSGRHPLPFVLVRDVAKAMALAMDAPGIDGKTFNLCGDVTISAREYVRLAGERTLRPFRYYPRNLLLFMTQVAVKTACKRVLGRRDAPQHYRDMVSSAMFAPIDNQAAKRALGWRPNADPDVFVREAIECHAEPCRPGDLRLGS
jgi:nucleoside-diphosphate-sugar epimerase